MKTYCQVTKESGNVLPLDTKFIVNWETFVGYFANQNVFFFFPDTFHKVLYTFHGQMEGDLSVAEGEVVRVCEKQNEDW